MICQCCGRPLGEIEQKWPHKPSTFFVTCWTKHLYAPIRTWRAVPLIRRWRQVRGCAAYGYTVNAAEYAGLNMATYGRRAS